MEWEDLSTEPFPCLTSSFITTTQNWTLHPQHLNPHIAAARILFAVRFQPDNSHEDVLCGDFACDGFVDEVEAGALNPNPEVAHSLNSLFCLLKKCGVEVEGLPHVAILRELQPHKPNRAPAMNEWVLLTEKCCTFVPLPFQDLETLPFFYPKVVAYRVMLRETDESTHVTCQCVRGQITDPISPSLQSISQRITHKAVTWCTNNEKGYKKQTPTDQLIEHRTFSEMYSNLKQKYRYLVEIWPECTDPVKYVFEDIAIASFLLCLWKQEREKTGSSRMQRFLDVGCGNGLLSFILTQEGHPGQGVDLKRRGVWEIFSKSADLIEADILSGTAPSGVEDETTPLRRFCEFNKNLVEIWQGKTENIDCVDWVVANHADEIIPYCPVLAAGLSPTCRFFALPCCMFTFGGERFRPTKQDTGVTVRGRFAAYLQHIENIARACGFEVSRDRLRIPSVKCIALVGASRVQSIQLPTTTITTNPTKGGASAQDGERPAHLVSRDRHNAKSLALQSMGSMESVALTLFRCVVVCTWAREALRHKCKAIRFAGILCPVSESVDLGKFGEGEICSSGFVVEDEVLELDSSSPRRGVPINKLGELFVEHENSQGNTDAVERLRGVPGGLKSLLGRMPNVFHILREGEGQKRPAVVAVRHSIDKWQCDVHNTTGSGRKKPATQKSCFFFLFGRCEQEGCVFKHC